MMERKEAGIDLRFLTWQGGVTVVDRKSEEGSQGEKGK